MDKKLSIIIPIYNVEKYLEQALDSLAKQNLDECDVEFLLINDGSTDGSVNIARHYVDADNRFRLYDRTNFGYGATLNYGIEQANGKYIGVLEPDDWVDTGMYSEMLKRANDFELDIVRCNYKKVWSGGIREAEIIKSSMKIMPDLKFSPKDTPECFFFHPAIWSMIVKREMLIENGIRLLETPGAAFQDTSYSFKLWTCARSAMLVDEAYVNYRQDNESSSINNPNTSKFVHLEYSEIEAFLDKNGIKEQLGPVMMRRQFLAYVWNFERLDKSLHLKFAKQAHDDMARLFKSGMFDQSLYLPWEVSDLNILLKSSESFVRFKDSTPKILRKLKHLKDALR